MDEATFPERRTRSQLTLPDNILTIPDCSPLKGARTALRKHISTISGHADESEDELLLSPGKPQHHMKALNAKRSASPTPQDEYKTFPHEGRDLKRIRHDGIEGDESNTEKSQRSSGHSRTHSDSNIILAGRSNRKKSTPKVKKPVSAVSDCPPIPFSPALTTVKGRAQSVPVFFTSHDIPRIDLRNPPRSPKRRRSPSRSPSKDRTPKLRIMPSIFRLPTIQDDVNMNAHGSDTPRFDRTSELSFFAVDNVDVGQSGKAVNISEASGTPSGRERIQSSTSPRELIPPSPSKEEMVTASRFVGQVIASSSPPSHTEIIPASPPASYKPMIRPIISTTLATPSIHSLNKLIPMSPLTPLPDTPLPAKFMMSADIEDRSTENAGWGLEPMKGLTLQPESNKPTIAPSASQSRLPRPSTAPLVHSSKPLQPSKTMGPPTMLHTSKKTAHVQRGDSSTAVANQANRSAPKKDAFALMMKRPLEQKARLEADRSKLKGEAKKEKAMPPPPAVDKGKDIVYKESPVKPKIKLKEKMRPRQKQEVKPAFSIVLPSDEEEDIEEGEKEKEGEMEGEIEVTDSKAGGDSDIIPIEALNPTDEPNPEESALRVANDGKDEHATKMANIVDQLIPEVGADVTPTQPEELGIQKPSLDIPQTEIYPESCEPPTQALATEDIEPEVSVTDAVSLAGAQTVEPPVEDEPQETAQPQPPSRATRSKVGLGKKRQPAIPLPSRVTRSVSNQKKTGVEGAQTGSSTKSATLVPSVPAAAKRAASGSLKKPTTASVETVGDVSGSAMAVDSSKDNAGKLLLASPMRLSPAKSSPKTSTINKPEEQVTAHDDMDVLSSISTPTKSTQPPPSPSPTKIARSTLLAMKPTAASIARTFSSSSLHSAPNSSLSNLSSALEKLRMPAPSRPSTSMGFNHDTVGDDADRAPPRSKDDVVIGRTSIGLGRKAGSGIQRLTTIGSSSFKPSGNATASSSKSSTSSGAKLMQKPLSMFMSGKGGVAKPGTGARRIGPFGNKFSIFGIGGGPRRTVSKKSTLPVVIGSPVKGGIASRRDEDETMREVGEAAEKNDEEAEGEVGGNLFNAIMNGGSATVLMANLLAQGSDKGKEKESSHRPVHSSRRVSMLSRDLSHSLNAMPPPAPTTSGARGTMGPPATPPKVGRVDTNPGSGGSGSSASGSPSQAGPSGAKRSSARIANAAPAMKAKANTDGPISAGKRAAAAVPVNPAMMILKDCVIFVDVKSEDGDEAGSLFIEMLEGVGARVLTRVGQSCTHIVFKNGLTSTITRYKLLRDPKPLVVGIGWVVECIEQRAQVDETVFLIDLDRINIAGHNKRRRSILPKLFAEEEPSQDDNDEGDRSMDGSVSSITMDDDLTPLEKARRRKNKLAGPN